MLRGDTALRTEKEQLSENGAVTAGGAAPGKTFIHTPEDRADPGRRGLSLRVDGVMIPHLKGLPVTRN